MSINIDLTELESLSRSLGRSPVDVVKAVDKVMARGALNVKRQMQDEARASGIAEAAKLAGFISYARSIDRVAQIRYEVGPREGNAGSFAFLYFGNSKNGPVLPDPLDALEREAPNIEQFALNALSDLL